MRPADDHGKDTFSCAMCAGADPARQTPLQRILPPGQSRFIARSEQFAAFPTFGCFTPGYVLIIPRAHVLSFGRLGRQALAEAQQVADTVAARISEVYQMPVLGFEYGNNMPGGRRVAHAHWHLLPTEADLGGWLTRRMDGQLIRSFTELPCGGDSSYIAVRTQQGQLMTFSVPNRPRQAVRLRRLVAELDPRIDATAWDWASSNHDDLIRQTAADLAGHLPAGTMS